MIVATPPAYELKLSGLKIAVAHVDNVGGAKLGGKLQFHRVVVDRDDAAGADDCRAIDGRHADTTAADHHHRLPRRHLGGVEHGADAGNDATADQRGAVERHVLADLYDRILVDQHLLGEGRHVEELVDRSGLLPGHAGRNARWQLDFDVGADRRPA